MTPAPLVSIIIPCFNYGRFLAEAIESALAQTYGPIEIFVIDDGSTDDSLDVARRYEDCVTVVSQENAGVIATCNRGVERAHGDYFTFLSADDRFEPRYVEALLDALRRDARAAFAYSDVRLFGAESRVVRSVPFNPFALVQIGNYVNGSALTRRDAYLAAGGYTSDLEAVGYEDWDLWLRMIERGERGTYVPEPLLLWRRHEGNSRNPSLDGSASEAAAVIRARHPELVARADAAPRLGILPSRAVVAAPPLAKPRPLRRLLERLSWRQFSARR